MAGTLTMVNFFRLQECVVADGQLRESGVGYYWLSDYFTIIDDFGKQYMGRGSKVSSEKVIEEGVVYHSAAGFQIRCVRQ